MSRTLLHNHLTRINLELGESLKDTSGDGESNCVANLQHQVMLDRTNQVAALCLSFP